jgi:hypothetical protein
MVEVGSVWRRFRLAERPARAQVSHRSTSPTRFPRPRPTIRRLGAESVKEESPPAPTARSQPGAGSARCRAGGTLPPRAVRRPPSHVRRPPSAARRAPPFRRLPRAEPRSQAGEGKGCSSEGLTAGLGVGLGDPPPLGLGLGFGVGFGVGFGLGAGVGAGVGAGAQEPTPDPPPPLEAGGAANCFAGKVPGIGKIWADRARIPL